VAHSEHHRLQFGGSPVGAEPSIGKVNFRREGRIPVVTVGNDMDDANMRTIRYILDTSIGHEHPFHPPHRHVVLDVRAVREWEEESAPFLASVRDALRQKGGELHLVAYPKNLRAGRLESDFTTYESLEDALAAATAANAPRRPQPASV
jgi:anti-anti-sigma regulatory factor